MKEDAVNSPSSAFNPKLNDEECWEDSSDTVDRRSSQRHGRPYGSLGKRESFGKDAVKTIRDPHLKNRIGG